VLFLAWKDMPKYSLRNTVGSRPVPPLAFKLTTNRRWGPTHVRILYPPSDPAARIVSVLSRRLRSFLWFFGLFFVLDPVRHPLTLLHSCLCRLCSAGQRLADTTDTNSIFLIFIPYLRTLAFGADVANLRF
ncbi:hypothetical protein B296_00045270, partial [Ensete ventricosum]